MTQEKKTSAVESLQGNVSQFFDRFFEKYQNHMKCGLGCSSCCQSGLTVFPVEAQRIFEWWDSLETAQREELQRRWSKCEVSAESGSREASCAFLLDKYCSIYPARPVVCRSQGLPMKVSVEKQKPEQIRSEFELSLCELNFTADHALPEQREWLDLDRLNVLLSIAQQQSDGNNNFHEVGVLSRKHGTRIPLSEIHQLLLHKEQ